MFEKSKSVKTMLDYKHLLRQIKRAEKKVQMMKKFQISSAQKIEVQLYKNLFLSNFNIFTIFLKSRYSMGCKLFKWSLKLSKFELTITKKVLPDL